MRAFRHTLVPRDFNNHDTNPVSSFTRRTVVLMNVSHTLPQQALKCMSHRFLRVRTYACVRLVQDLQARGVAASVSSLVCPRRHSVVRQPSRPTVGGCHRVCKGSRFSGWCRISSGVRRRRSPGVWRRGIGLHTSAAVGGAAPGTVPSPPPASAAAAA